MIHRTWLFTGRTMKEVVRDPLNLFFALLFPILLLWMMHAIQQSIPAGGASKNFMAIDNLAPGVASFATVFMALFAGMILARDRTSAFLTRLFASPMTAGEFLAGYTVPMLVIAMVQVAVTFLASLAMGLKASWGMVAALILIVPVALLYVAFGLLAGCLLSVNAVGGICGALLTIVVAWCSGIWIPIDLLGGTFKHICDFLPFRHAVLLMETCIKGDWSGAWPNLWPVLVWTIALYALAIGLFAHVKRDR